MNWDKLPAHLEARICSEISAQDKFNRTVISKKETTRKSSIELEILWKVSTNKIYESRHWSERSKLKNQYRDYYVALLKKGLTPVIKYPVKITYTCSFKGVALDSTNISYMCKLWEDCMVKAGILEDDSPKYVRSTELISQKGKEDKVLIEIT